MTTVDFRKVKLRNLKQRLEVLSRLERQAAPMINGKRLNEMWRISMQMDKL